MFPLAREFRERALTLDLDWQAGYRFRFRVQILPARGLETVAADELRLRGIQEKALPLHRCALRSRLFRGLRGRILDRPDEFSGVSEKNLSEGKMKSDRDLAPNSSRGHLGREGTWIDVAHLR
jgi:hypothetical protein